MDSSRRTSLVTGGLFIITFVTSIPAVFLLNPGAGRRQLRRWGQ
jgi:hypothetical protein